MDLLKIGAPFTCDKNANLNTRQNKSEFFYQRIENGRSKKFEVTDLNGKINFHADVDGHKKSMVLMGEEANKVRDLLNSRHWMTLPIKPIKPLKPIKPIKPFYTTFESPESIQRKMDAYQDELKSARESYQTGMTKYQTKLNGYQISQQAINQKSMERTEQLTELLDSLFKKHFV